MKALAARALWLATLAMFVAGMQACASQRVTVLRPASARVELEPGDEATITLKDGTRYRVIVVESNDEELVTKVRHYAWSEIDRVAVQEVDVGATLAQYVTVHLILSGLIYILASETFED